MITTPPTITRPDRPPPPIAQPYPRQRISAERHDIEEYAPRSSDPRHISAILDELKIPAPVSLQSIIADPPAKPDPLIDGILTREAVMLFAGSSKSKKTWALLDLATAIGTGGKWFGFTCHRTGALWVNMELHEHEAHERTVKILDAKGTAPEACAMFMQNLKGITCTFEAVCAMLEPFCRDHGIGAVIFDPYYRLVGHRDENAAGDIADLLDIAHRFAKTTKTGVIICHHFAKGDPTEKAPIDRPAGSGVIGRAVDALITLTAHEEEEAAAVDFIVRSFKTPKPFAVRFRYPLWQRDDSLDPRKLKTLGAAKAKGGRPAVNTPESIRTVLTDHGAPMTPDELKQACAAVGISGGTFNRYLTSAKAAKIIELESGLYRAVISKTFIPAEGA